MASFNGQALFSSGPAAFAVQGWRVATRRDGFPGVDGVRQLVLGARGRKIRQWGYLTSAVAGSLAALIDCIEEYQRSSEPCTLVDNYGRSFANAVMTAFTRRPIRRTASGYIVRYEIEYLQLSD